MRFKLVPLPPDAKRGWDVRIDGELVRPGIIVVESVYGVLTVGQHPRGFMTFAFAEEGGGGAVTLPFAWSPQGELLVGLLLEDRPNMGGEVWCIAGGFVAPGESHADAQVRRVGDETGLDTARAFRLEGLGTNANRAFFVADAATEGVIADGLERPYGWLAPDADGGRLKSAPSAATEAGVNLGKAGNVRFFPWEDAVLATADGLARSAIAQLLAGLKKGGRNF